jgi:hypothetical protein
LIVGKYAQTSGCVTMRGSCRCGGSGQIIWKPATPRPGQKIIASGTGIGTTQMKGATTGRGICTTPRSSCPVTPDQGVGHQPDRWQKWKRVTDLSMSPAAQREHQDAHGQRHHECSWATLTAVPVDIGAILHLTHS